MAKLTDFQALLFDVDLTLSNSQRSISSLTERLLKQLASQGYQLGVCTGRPYASLRKGVVQIFPEDSLHITCGGAQIITSRGEVIWEKVIAAETTKSILAEAQKYNLSFYIPEGEFGYGTDLFIQQYENLHKLVAELKPIAELQNFDVPIIAFFNIGPEFLAYLKSRTDIQVKLSRSGKEVISVDVTALGVTKATALTEWCQLQNLSSTDIIGFGDSDNDLEFLGNVGLAVAMGNASEAIMSIADKVIGHADEDGVGIYLEKITQGAEV